MFPRPRVPVLLLALFLTVGPGPAGSAQQAELVEPEQRMAGYEQHHRMQQESSLAGLPWQFVGPTNISGRSTDIAVVSPRGKSYTIYVATASGGVWKTANEGVTWQPILDQAASTSVGDVTVAPSNPDIVWVGTGEANIFRSSMAGIGVFKSTDAGESWEYKGLGATHTIPRIVIHPTDPDVVYVAASGKEWSDNPERGIYKSIDGGDSWEHVLYVDERTGAIDLVMDPSNPDTLYAATWERIRRKWNDPRVEPGYDGSGIWKSTDAGSTWEPINEGLPEAGSRGRIGIGISQSSPNILYAFLDNYEDSGVEPPSDTDAYGRPRGAVIKGATVYRSDDAGATWVQTSEENDYMRGLGGTYGWVFGQIRVDPVNPDKIYVMGLGLNVSEDRGKTFRRLTGMHGDHHGLWIDPDNTDYLVNANDGGVYVSYDGGENWRFFVDIPAVQFFNVAHDMDTPFRVYGSVQDHGSFRGTIDLSRGRNNVAAVEWDRAPGGEGSNHVIDPTNPDTVYAAGFYGSLMRADMATGETERIRPADPEDGPPLRGQWLAPFILSPHNPRIVYLGLNKLFRSLDQGSSWEALSEDLTYNDIDQIGDIQYQTIYSISESPHEFGKLYVGTDDGRVWTTDGSGAGGWGEITGELPQGKVIAEIVASQHHEGRVYLVQNGKRDDDFTPYLWWTENDGTTWQDLGGGIPIGPVNVIKEDPTDPNVLYVGTDVGVYASLDGGATWQVLGHGLPSTFVQDIVIHPTEDMLVAGTHGRGVWVLDVRPLKGLDTEIRAQAVAVLATESLSAPSGGFRFGGGLPEASVAYWLSEAGATEVLVEDAQGEVVRTLEAPGDAGVNVVTWDLRGEPREGGGGFFGGGRFVEPGTYTVRVRSNGAEAVGTVEIGG